MNQEPEIQTIPYQELDGILRLPKDTPSKIYWGEINPNGGTFPEKTKEEIIANLQCGLQTLREAEKAFSGSLETARKFCNTLTKKEKEESITSERTILWENKVFAAVQTCLLLPHNPENGENSQRHLLLNHIGRKLLLKKMRPEQGISLAIQAIRIKDATAFKKIIFNFKTIDKKHPRGRTELLDIPLSDGRSLGHLAAQVDFQAAIQYIAYNHRTLLEKKDSHGETLVHTASRFQATETIHYLLGLSKRLFGEKNNKGETPLDLESGPSICKSIAIAIVEQDIQAGEATLRKALEACRVTQNKPKTQGQTPATLLKSPKLEMEKILLSH